MQIRQAATSVPAAQDCQNKNMKKLIVYFIVILVACQVLVDIYALIDHAGYVRAGFYLGAFFGTNLFVAIFFLAFSYSFKFCKISRACAWAEMLFNINFIIVKEDNLYNLLFQIIIGVIALTVTFDFFIKKFPLCRISLLWQLILSFGVIFTGGKCDDVVNNFDSNIKESLVKKMYPNGQYNKQHP